MSSRPLIFLLTLLLALSLPAPVRAAWQQFQESDVTDLHEAPDGRVWAATRAGVRVFDGRSWETRNPPTSRTPTRVLVDHTGALWVISNLGGVWRFDGASWNLPGDFTAVVPDSQARAIVEDRAGDVWIGFVTGLARYRRAADRWEWLDTGNSGLAHNAIDDILEDREGALWFAFGRAGGLSILDSTRTAGGWRQEDIRPGGLAQDSIHVLGLGGDGAVWGGSYTGASQRQADGSWRRFTGDDGLPSDSIMAIAGDGRGGVWFGADASGIGHYDGRSFRVERTTASGLAIGGIRSMLRGSSGDLWLGSGGGGLLRSDDVEWRTVGDSLPTADCRPVSTPPSRTEVIFRRSSALTTFEDRAGNLWFGPDESPVAVLDTTGRWRNLERAPGRPFADSVGVILEDRAGVLHFGSRRSGVISFDPAADVVVAATQGEGLMGDHVDVLFEDSARELWAGGPSGLARRRAGVWSALPEFAGLDVRQVEEDGSGALCVRTGTQLFRISPARDEVRPVDLAGNTFYLPEHPLARRADGTLWVGLRQGLFRVDDDTLVGVPGPADTTLGTRIRNVSEDRLGRLWITTRDGVARLDGAGWEGYRAQPQGPVAGTPTGPVHVDDRDHAWVPTGAGVSRFDGRAWKLVTAADGLASNQVESILEDHRGHLWFAGPCGATEHAPDRAAPQTVIDLAPVALSAVRDATFAYGFFGSEESVDFSYRLDAATEGAWSAFSPQTSFSATGLADGTHRFDVRARDAAGNVDPTPAVVVWDIDATPPPARIDVPANRAAVDSLVTIEGTTADPRLRRWRLDVKPAAGAWDANAVELAPWTSEGRVEAMLATWDSRGVADGEYDLRVVTQDSLGLEAIGEVRVLVDNVAPFADVTSPRDVTRQAGGEVFTAEGDGRLYLQPGALDRDARVTLVGAPAPPPAIPPLPSGTGLVRRWYEVAWPGATLLKPATLDLAAAGPAAALAVHRYREGEGWTRLGGTAMDSTRLTLAIDQEGGYAVVEEAAAAPEGAFTLAGLRFSPRLFTPGQGGAGGALSIAFELGRAATVDVRVHNRAGRLVDEIARGSFAAGANLVTWDGRDRNGEAVPGGLYVVTVEALGDRLQNTIVVTP